MIETPTIVQTQHRLAAVIHMRVAHEKMKDVMGPAIGELMRTIGAQGIPPAGPIFDHHHTMEPGVFDFELGVPITIPVRPDGRVKPGELPACRAARTIYHGGYEGLGPAWGEFDAWLRANNHTPAPNLWESYLVGPESGPDSSKWRTELIRPLVE